jgi:osmotically-inducible protein OsmY
MRLWLLFFALLVPAAAQKKIDDNLIYDQVRRVLANDPDVKGGAFNVDVKEGVVTVQGKVDKERSRQKVDKLCKKVKGVAGVVNQVKVEP